MIKVRNKAQCTGCTACSQACPYEAISIAFDDAGHGYPEVERSKCVDCGLCDKICPLLNKDMLPIDNKLLDLKSYAVYSKNDTVREKSTSGGIFTVLATHIIDQGGVVYASRFDHNFHIIHDRLDNLADIDLYRGSKYAQSELGNTFRKIKKDLKDHKVLFIGTPCQVVGLKSFLIKDYVNLYTCDFICLGISSPKFWDEYIRDFWKGHHIKRIFFKDKRNGWHNWKMLIEHDKGEYLVDGNRDPFFYSYLSHLSFRPSCLNCAFRSCRRMSDFTIADCWGIDKVAPHFDDNKGCSTLILQSSKGMELYNKIKENLNYIEYSIENVKRYNPYIVTPIQPHPIYEDYYYKLITKYGFLKSVEICRKRTKGSLAIRLLRKLKRML